MDERLEVTTEVKRSILDAKLNSFKQQIYEQTVNEEIFNALGEKDLAEKAARHRAIAKKSAEEVLRLLDALPKEESVEVDNG